MARVELGVSRMRTRRRKRRILLALIAFFLVIILLCILVWLSRAPFLRITTLHVSGTQTIATSTIENLARGELGGFYGYLFAKDNIFLYPKGKIASKLIVGVPTLESVNVHAENFHTIALAVVERHPKALWCGVEVASSSNCFYIDESGAAYARDGTGGGYIRYYGPLIGSSTPKLYLHGGQFRSLWALIDAIGQSSKNDKIVSVYVDGNSDVHALFASGFTLLFELSADGGDVYQRLQLALSAEPFKSRTLKDFLYLDLRFGDKLYYKLK